MISDISSNQKFLIIIMLLLLGWAISLFAQSPQSYTDLKLETLLLNEFKKHPQMQVQDIYKLLHQAVMGSEHAVKNKESAVEWMNNEIKGLNREIADSMIDTICIEKKIVRVNLRPYLNSNYDPIVLVEAFINTANNFKGSKEKLEEYLDIVLIMSAQNRIPFEFEELDKFFNEKKSKGYPAVHHSKIYEAKYKPAYRVISAENLSQIFKK